MLKYIVRDLRIVTLKTPRERLPRKMYPAIVADDRANTLEDRNLRQQAGTLNAQAKMLKYVVRDLRIVTLKTPRELLPRKMYPAIVAHDRANSCQLSSIPDSV
ncbi:unnamed protein product [Toxocara canis]|uniref:Transposase n=1 Tax=Toxocara canis TaxID=6265 RepID=A0A183VCN9_TOXCA|nr:unnamed protein product [Toxocara canis]